MLAAFLPNVHTCTAPTPKPHVGGVVLPVGKPRNVFVGAPGLLLARSEDEGTCAGDPGNKNPIVTCSPNVHVGGHGHGAARQGDKLAHKPDSEVLLGWPTVEIGGDAQVPALSSDKAFGDVCSSG